MIMYAQLPAPHDRTGPASWSSRVVNLPSGSQSETLALSGSPVAGRYLVSQSCHYDADGRVDMINYRSRWLDIPTG
jgi:hypothetical protein